jgi:transketolase
MTAKTISMRDSFLERILQAMSEDESIFFVTADFGAPVLDNIREQFPKRFVNVGIAEQNLINISTGLSLEGYKVFAYAIAPFITMRCYEQIRVNLALLSQVRQINVNLIGVGARYSYVVSGPTHQCYEDLTIMRALPNLSIYSPADHMTAVALFEKCISTSGPKYLRFDAQVLPVIYDNILPDIESGFNVLRKGSHVCIIATGFMVNTALELSNRLAKQKINLGVIDLFDITGFNAELFQSALLPYTGLISMEEGFKGCGGLDAMVFDFVNKREMDMRFMNIGVSAAYSFELGTRESLHELVGIGADIVEKKIMNFSNSRGL